MKRIAVVALFSFLLASPFSKILISFEQKKESSSLKKDVSAIEQNLFKMINEEREKLGLSLLKFSPPLSLLARKHSRDMALRENISHLSSSGTAYSERLVEEGFFFRKNGENVAFSESFMAEFIHKGFMESPGHKKNILEPKFDEVGIGVIFKENKGYYVTQDFILSLMPMEEKEAKKEIQKKTNDLRRENSLPPLLFTKEAEKYTQQYSLRKAENRTPPVVPSHFGEVHILHISAPSLEKVHSVYKDKILDEIYESAAIGISFGRNKEYRGGSYFITLILFPENKYKSWSNKDLKELIFGTINKIKEKKGINRFKWDESLTAHADRIVKRIRTQKKISEVIPPKFQRTAFFSYVTENPTLLPKSLKEKIEGNLIGYKRIGIGILFEKSHKFPRGTFWVSILLEE